MGGDAEKRTNVFKEHISQRTNLNSRVFCVTDFGGLKKSSRCLLTVLVHSCRCDRLGENYQINS